MKRPLAAGCQLFAPACFAVFSATAFCADSAIGTGPLPSGITALGPLTILNSERFSIQSRKVGKRFIVDIARVGGGPFGPPPGGKLPVVFVTDNDSFPALVPALASGSPGSQFPPMIVVGIGYDLSGASGPMGPLVEFAVRRAEDFTPSNDKTYKSFTPQALQLFDQSGVQVPDSRLGRADNFLAFINEELKPFIAERYHADVEDSALVGHSMGGLFVDIPARVFMGVGGEDEPEVLEATPRLDIQIRAHSRPNLRYTYKFFPGENHLSMFSVGVMSGLRAVFDPPALPGPSASTGKGEVKQ